MSKTNKRIKRQTPFLLSKGREGAPNMTATEKKCLVNSQNEDNARKRKPEDEKGSEHKKLPQSTTSHRSVKIAHIDARFPMKPVLFAVALVLGGVTVLLFSPHHWGIFFAHSPTNALPHLSFGSPVNIVLGLLVTLPGVYVCGLAFFAYKRYEGYTYDLIPGSFEYF